MPDKTRVIDGATVPAKAITVGNSGLFTTDASTSPTPIPATVNGTKDDDSAVVTLNKHLFP